jgi:hypothetical protein
MVVEECPETAFSFLRIADLHPYDDDSTGAFIAILTFSRDLEKRSTDFSRERPCTK